MRLVLMAMDIFQWPHRYLDIFMILTQDTAYYISISLRYGKLTFLGKKHDCFEYVRKSYDKFLHWSLNLKGDQY